MRHVIYSVAKSAAPAGKIVYLDTWYDLAFHYFIIACEAIAGISQLLTVCFTVKFIICPPLPQRA